LAWKVEPKKKLELSKPAGFKFPGLGWLRGDVAVAKGWVLGSDEVEEGLTLDEIVPEGEIRERLASANAAMEGVNPQRIAAIVRLTLRRDTRLVQALKMYRDYRCQFPNCGVRITKRGGGYYIQVAHIKPVSAQGRSQLGNLVVLCPNHHSEFDYGDLVILEQGDDLLCGTLNGVRFEISLA
jgi:putative restriction endonuclease